MGCMGHTWMGWWCGEWVVWLWGVVVNEAACCGGGVDGSAESVSGRVVTSWEEGKGDGWATQGWVGWGGWGRGGESPRG